MTQNEAYTDKSGIDRNRQQLNADDAFHFVPAFHGLRLHR